MKSLYGPDGIDEKGWERAMSKPITLHIEAMDQPAGLGRFRRRAGCGRTVAVQEVASDLATVTCQRCLDRQNELETLEI